MKSKGIILIAMLSLAVVFAGIFFVTRSLSNVRDKALSDATQARAVMEAQLRNLNQDFPPGINIAVVRAQLKAKGFIETKGCSVPDTLKKAQCACFSGKLSDRKFRTVIVVHDDEDKLISTTVTGTNFY